MMSLQLLLVIPLAFDNLFGCCDEWHVVAFLLAMV